MRKFNVFEAVNIDGGHSIALWVNALAIRMNATYLTETVLDDVLFERVRTNDAPLRTKVTGAPLLGVSGGAPCWASWVEL